MIMTETLSSLLKELSNSLKKPFKAEDKNPDSGNVVSMINRM